MRLENREALIIGVGEDIGFAVARRFAQEGAIIVACETNLSIAERVVCEIKNKKGKAFPVECNTSNHGEIVSVVDKIIDKFGRIDILVNRVSKTTKEPFLDMEMHAWKKVFEFNFDDPCYFIQTVSRYMAKQQYGKIINFSAPNLEQSDGEGASGFAVSAGIKSLTCALSKELGRYSITVNCIELEFINTEEFRESARKDGLYLDDVKKLATSLVALRRLGTPEEVAGVCLFLSSEEGSFVSGQIIGVKGGP